MRITKEDLLRDKKENPFVGKDKIDSILKFFVGDLENKTFNEDEYRSLGWIDNEYFDVIHSFYTTYKYALDKQYLKYKETYAKKALDSAYKLDQWQKWLRENKDEYCLDCCYEVGLDGRLEGKPLFDGQTLENPYPKGEEVEKCVRNMINCIKTRANKLFDRINVQVTKER